MNQINYYIINVYKIIIKINFLTKSSKALKNFRTFCFIGIIFLLISPLIGVSVALPSYCGVEEEDVYAWQVDWNEYEYSRWHADNGTGLVDWPTYLKTEEGVKLMIDSIDDSLVFLAIVNYSLYTIEEIINGQDENAWILNTTSFTPVYDYDSYPASFTAMLLWAMPYVISLNLDWYEVDSALEDYVDALYGVGGGYVTYYASGSRNTLNIELIFFSPTYTTFTITTVYDEKGVLYSYHAAYRNNNILSITQYQIQNIVLIIIILSAIIIIATTSIVYIYKRNVKKGLSRERSGLFKNFKDFQVRGTSSHREEEDYLDRAYKTEIPKSKIKGKYTDILDRIESFKRDEKIIEKPNLMLPPERKITSPICLKCGAHNPKDANFCIVCGNEIVPKSNVIIEDFGINEISSPLETFQEKEKLRMDNQNYIKEVENLIDENEEIKKNQQHLIDKNKHYKKKIDKLKKKDDHQEKAISRMKEKTKMLRDYLFLSLDEQGKFSYSAYLEKKHKIKKLKEFNAIQKEMIDKQNLLIESLEKVKLDNDKGDLSKKTIGFRKELKELKRKGKNYKHVNKD